MKYLLLIFILLSTASCLKQTNSTQDDDYVLVEFAAKLEEDQEKFQKLQNETTAP